MRGAENFRFFADRAPRPARPVAARHGARRTTRCASRSGPSASSRRGTRRSCCRPGRSRPRSRPAARSCTSRPSGARSRRRCSPRSARDRSRAAAGRLNTVHGLGETAGKALTEHPAIKAVGFVGESRDRQRDHGAGRADAEARAFRARRQEPGHRVRGRGPRPRARRRRVHDLQPERRALHVVEPRCWSQRSIYEGFTRGWPSACKRIKVGHPLDPATEIGPLIHPRHVEKVLSFPTSARAEGATRSPCGGGARHGRQRQLRRADALSRRQRTACASRRRRSSGPSSPWSLSTTRPRRCKLANDVRYGLAGVSSGPATSAARIASPASVEAGMIWVNSENMRHLPTPFGGMKASGIGRDGGDYSLRLLHGDEERRGRLRHPQGAEDRGLMGQMGRMPTAKLPGSSH